jgi:hypothetical protein
MRIQIRPTGISLLGCLQDSAHQLHQAESGVEMEWRYDVSQGGSVGMMQTQASKEFHSKIFRSVTPA